MDIGTPSATGLSPTCTGYSAISMLRKATLLFVWSRLILNLPSTRKHDFDGSMMVECVVICRLLGKRNCLLPTDDNVGAWGDGEGGL
jgi:hypothetical protein